MKYKISTNPVALSRAWTALNTVNLSGIPQVDAGDDIETIACELVVHLASVPSAYNSFFHAITGSEEDFTEKTQKEGIDLAINFCQSINDPFLRLIKKFLKESKELNDSVTLKMKLMQIENMKEITKKILENPEAYAHLLKS